MAGIPGTEIAIANYYNLSLLMEVTCETLVEMKCYKHFLLLSIKTFNLIKSFITKLPFDYSLYISVCIVRSLAV